MCQKKTRKCEKIRSKRRIVGIRSDQGFREAMAVMVKRWTPLLFSCQISNNEWRSVQKGYVKQEQECFWPLFWSHRYRANGTVTSNEKAFSAGGANVRWNSTMMLKNPKNNINPAVFISIFSLFGRMKNYYFRATVAFVGIIFRSRLHFWTTAPYSNHPWT